jgi:hypothetical protein
MHDTGRPERLKRISHEEDTMIRTRKSLVAIGLGVTALLCGGLAAGQTKAAPAKAESGCTLASLKGNFGFSITGTNTRFNVPFAFVGRMTADGAGNVTGRGTQSRGGQIVMNVGISGTYKVMPECMGISFIKFENEPNAQGRFEFVIVNDGREFYFIDVAEGTVESGSASLISSRR